jgi:hypothetical protein
VRPHPHVAYRIVDNRLRRPEIRIADGKNNDILAALLHRHGLFVPPPGITGVGVQASRDIAKMIFLHMPLL